MNVLAVIPARAGSRGVPGKNVRPCVDRPLLAWSIQAAKEANLVTQTVVSSDSEEILAVARRYGAETLLRPAELATDTAATDPVLAHAVRAVTERPDLVVLLQPTVPLRRPGLVDECIQRLLDTDADSLFTARAMPYCWWREDEGGWAENAVWRTNNPRRFRRQDLPPVELFWDEDGSVYVSRTFLLVSEHPGIQTPPHRIGGRVQVYPNERTVDVDTEADFAMAEALLAHRMREEGPVTQADGAA